MYIEIYAARRGLGRQKWRWRAVADNGRITANGGEAYANFADCEHAVGLIVRDDIPVRTHG